MTCRTKLLSLLAITLIHAGATRVAAAELPTASSAPVIFSRDIQPIFEASCIKCHARGRDKGGFRLDTRETILKGGDSGPAAIPGRSAESLLVELVAGLDPDNVMPQKGTRLTSEQVGLVRAWIDQGLPWGEGVTFARKDALNLVPRRPALPSAPADAASHHPVDLLIAAGYGNPAPKLRSDRGRPDVCAPRVFRSDRAAPPHRRNWKRSWRAPRPTNASDWWINCFRTTAAMRSTG